MDASNVGGLEKRRLLSRRQGEVKSGSITFTSRFNPDCPDRRTGQSPRGLRDRGITGGKAEEIRQDTEAFRDTASTRRPKVKSLGGGPGLAHYAGWGREKVEFGVSPEEIILRLGTAPGRFRTHQTIRVLCCKVSEGSGVGSTRSAAIRLP